MKRILFAIGLLAAVTLSTKAADYRTTRRNSNVLVTRQRPPWWGNQAAMKALKDFEDQRAGTLKDMVVVKSVLDFQWDRNCHDFAWAPYMSCKCGTAGGQPEAWWMNDPSANWVDQSMEQKVVSVVGAGQGGEIEYQFNRWELDALPDLYYDDLFFELIDLPVCPLDNLSQVPVHSAVLIEWHDSTNDGLAYGVYLSKWGHNGLYRHRWGIGYCSQLYEKAASSLRIFAPKLGWSGCPPYPVYHTPWGSWD